MIDSSMDQAARRRGTFAAVIVAGLFAAYLTVADDAPVRPRPPMPAITKPVLFGTPEADRILSALQSLPSG